MPDTKITALTAITTVDPANDVLPIVDVSDTSMAASGTTKKITTNQLLGASGTATLASATITGNLTVDTNTLFVDSANNRVGIGTASPTVDLEVGDGTGTRTIKISGATNVFDIGFGSLRGGSTYGDVRLWTDRFRVYNAAGTQIIKNISGTNGDETWYDGAGGTRMTLNSTGLGVGVASPLYNIHARGTTNGRIQVEGASGFGMVFIQASSGNAAQLQLNSSGGSGRRYAVTSNSSGQFTIDDETGTANRLTIDTSGNVGIGVTPSAWGSNWKANHVGTVGSFASSGAGSAPPTAMVIGAYNDNTNWKYQFSSTGAARYEMTGANAGSAHAWYISPGGTAGNNITFTQAMTLDASGRLLVNNSSTGDNRFEVSGTNATNSYAAKFNGGSNTSNGVSFYLPGTRSSDTTYYLQRYGDDVATRFQIFGNGNVQNTTGTYGTISDLRLKENVSDARNYLADLLKLRVVKYSLKSDASPSANLLGLIAQEVEQVFPTLVETSGDDVKSVKTTVLIPMLLKALQELTARVQTLETR